MPNLVVKDCKGTSGGLALFWRRGWMAQLRAYRSITSMPW